MLGLSDLTVYVVALIAVYLLPGPDMALVMSSSVAHGTRNGLMTAIGLAASRALHVALSGLGLAAVLNSHPLLFTGVRWLGAGYLIWLAWKIIDSDGGLELTESPSSLSGLAAVQRGFLTNLLNPKALMFCALLLPQFVSSAAGNPFKQYAVLGVILVSLGMVFDLIYATAAHAFASRFVGVRRGRGLHKLVFSSVFGVAAFRLAFIDS